VQLAAALLHRPSLAILREPFSGLDPINQEFLLELIRDLSAQGTTVLFSAHQMQLVERLATQIAVMRNGQVVLEGTPAGIAEQWQAGDVLILQVGVGADVSALSSHPAVLAATVDGTSIRLSVRRGEPLGALLSDAARHYTIHGVQNERASLHDIYIRTVMTETTAQAGTA
jgi:ABC-2 type transport system ATP-binding protein